MKKKFATAILAGVLSAGMVLPAFATTPTTPDGGGSDNGVNPAGTGTVVQAGIIVQDKNPVVKVEVPTLFAFVVNGITDTSDSSSIHSGADGNLYLPNATVDVTTPAAAGTDGEYSLNISGQSTLPIKNYSTYEEAVSGEIVRQGLAVTINGEIKEVQGAAANKKYWVYSPDAATGVRADFKKYWISVEGIGLTTKTSDNGYKMASDITLTAPDTEYNTSTKTYGNLDSTTKQATAPSVLDAKFDVTVGGQRGQYHQVEESAKIGTIEWTVSTDVSAAGVETAPNNDYLAASGSNWDTVPTAP